MTSVDCVTVWNMDTNKKGHLLLCCDLLVFACLYVYVCFVFVRFSSIYGACHSKQTSNAGGFCVYVVSQLVARFKLREDVVRLARCL